jgi:glycosyltransferase involved in cell wall biosynthesis
VSDGRPTATVIIPALNEEGNIPTLIEEIRAVDPGTLPVTVTEIIVVDNGSTDATAERARAAGARVVPEPTPGYGRACHTGLLAATTELVIYMDGDRSEVPAEMGRVADPVATGAADLGIGSRVRGHAEPGALTPQQRVGNLVATLAMRPLYGVNITDLGPYRCMRRQTLLALGMRERTYGWPVEMIARTAQSGLRVAEVPVTCRRRGAGVSKVSGNLRASVKTAYRILAVIWGVRRERSRPA